MNKVQILDKIKRNLDQRGVAAVRGADNVTVGSIVITYVEAQIQKPMGGVDGSVSPFLGIGVANPGKLQVAMDVSAVTLGATELIVLREVFGFANDVVIVDGVTQIEVPAHADWQGMGQ